MKAKIIITILQLIPTIGILFSLKLESNGVKSFMYKYPMLMLIYHTVVTLYLLSLI